MDKDTEAFLRTLNKQNEGIAAREAKKEVRASEPNLDPIRIQREKDRREKWGQLRAREQPGNKSRRSSRSSDYVPLTSSQD